jgi:glutathione peroxidase
MRKRIFIVFLKVALLLIWPFHTLHAEPTAKNAYDFSFETLIGKEPFPLSLYKGHVLLIVNTASECGFTPQYAGLEKLYETYKDRGLVVIGVPSNDFGGQEPGSNEEIHTFCRINYGVTFPMTSKEHVIGPQAHPFYKWAYEQLGFGSAPKWNFHKYLIDRNGKLVTYFYSQTGPESDNLKDAMEKLLEDAPLTPRHDKE